MKTNLTPLPTPTTLLAKFIETPDLVRTIRRLPGQAFSALVRRVGVEDAGEIIALATTDQIVTAFDEDLFVNDTPGQRETFDAHRFIVWLEVLLEAGSDVVANRVAELSEDFVIHALSSIVLVLDYDALMARMSVGGPSAIYADKALDSSLSEEIDGYLLVSRRHDGWDAALALIVGLDRDHRPLLVRILDHCAAMASPYIDDLDELTNVLSCAESLAEDVEAEREDRRGKLGHMEPRAARAFLDLARQPLAGDIASRQRDPITRGYFRDLVSNDLATQKIAHDQTPLSGLLDRPTEARLLDLRAGPGNTSTAHDPATPFIEGMQLLKEKNPVRFSERMEELAYLANVFVAGATNGNHRFRPFEAADAALATVALGAEFEARAHRTGRQTTKVRATATELFNILSTCSADLLFRMASSMLAGSMLAGSEHAPDPTGFLHSRAELESAIERYSIALRGASSKRTRK